MLNVKEKNFFSNKVTLIGMMGTGKSKFGRIVANNLNYSFYDVDALIEKKFKTTIKELFEKNGELFFRKIEKQTIKSLFFNPKHKNEKSIISLGGGGFDDKDTLKIPIKANYIAHLGLEYTDSLLSLNYLNPKARSFLLDKKISYSLVKVEQIIDNYKSVADGNVDFEKAYFNFKNEPNGYNRANVWLSIINMKDEINKVKSILKIIKLETNNGRFKDATTLYLTILNDIDNSALTQELNENIQRLRVSSEPDLYPENNYSKIILLKEGKKWDWDLILNEKAWPLVPIVEKAGMIEPNSVDWLNNLKNLKDKNFKEDEFLKWERNYNLNKFLLTKSIQQQAKKDNKILTVLLIARLIGDNPLIDFDLSNLNIVRLSLNKIGLKNLANKITQEIMTSKIINL